MDYKFDANVEMDKYSLLCKIRNGNKDDLQELIEIITDEFNKDLGDVMIIIQIKKLICCMEVKNDS